MVLAAVLGVVVALIGCIPYLFALKRIKGMVSSQLMSGQIGFFLLTVFASFVILFIALILCVKLARPVALPFAAGEILTFIVVVIVFGVINRGTGK